MRALEGWRRPLGSHMSEKPKEKSVAEQQRNQMLKLVAKGFYNELTKYGVRKDEIIRVASHLLDNLMSHEQRPGADLFYYNQLFTLSTVKDEWKERKRLVVQHVELRPLQLALITKVIDWLKVPSVRESFVPAFPEAEDDLHKYFTDPTRDYFGIYYEGQPIGIVGGENIDPIAGKLEMKKLVGESGLQGKGIGKRATFGFLYHAFMIRNMNKVYIHSRDINVSNLNINSRFGFELEGVFFEDLRVGQKRQDVLRMALFKSLWTQIFADKTAIV